MKHTSYKAYTFGVVLDSVYICFAKSMWLWFNNQVKSGICHHANLRLHYVHLYAFMLPFMCTGWPDSIVYCKLQRSWPDCWASAQERSWCKPSDKGETSVCAPQTVLIWISFTMSFEICKVLYKHCYLCHAQLRICIIGGHRSVRIAPPSIPASL